MVAVGCAWEEAGGWVVGLGRGGDANKKTAGFMVSKGCCLKQQ